MKNMQESLKIAKNHKNKFLQYRSTRFFMKKPNLQTKRLIYVKTIKNDGKTMSK